MRESGAREFDGHPVREWDGRRGKRADRSRQFVRIALHRVLWAPAGGGLNFRSLFHYGYRAARRILH